MKYAMTTMQVVDTDKPYEEKVKPSYYAIIPADVRYSNIPPSAKLMYGEITALSGKEGYCWASNKYFAELYNVSRETVSRWIKQLVEAGFINKHIEYGKNKEVLRRKLTIFRVPPRINPGTPPRKKVKGINTSINIINIIPTLKENRREFLSHYRKAVRQRGELQYPAEFTDFFDSYPNKTGKKGMFEKWLATLDFSTPEELSSAAAVYAKACRGKEKQFVKHGATFLGPKEHWREYLKAEKPPAPVKTKTCPDCGCPYLHEGCKQCGYME